MTTQLVEVLILAAVALLVLARLYAVLGKRTGSERPAAQRNAQPVEPTPYTPPTPMPAPVSVSDGIGNGLSAISAADPAFDAGQFVTGARAAYEMIVGAFSSGDRPQLRELLNDRVYASYMAALDARTAESGKGPELVRLRHAEIMDARLDGDIAKVAVRFEAELADGQDGLRETREKWTFERDIRSRDPNWRLAGVAQA